MDLPEQTRFPRSEQGQRDLPLVRGALAGGPAAIDEFIRRMGCIPRMLSAGNQQLQSPLSSQDLEDLVQDTLVAVWKRLPAYNGRASLETWVYRFCFLELRYRLRKGRTYPLLLDDGGPNQPSEPAARPEISGLDYEHVLEGLKQLENDAAEIIRLKQYEDLTFDDIGERLSISANTAKSRYYRGLGKLRDLLGSPMGKPKTGRGS